jgi:hypothetical protein
MSAASALTVVPEAELIGSIDERIDALELAIIEFTDIIEPDVEHVFTPGLYRRTLRAPAGAIGTTYIHRQEHQFVVTKGVVEVSHGDGNWMRVEAPYYGITKVGTRRICVVFEDAEWSTFHPTTLTDIDEVERELFEFRTLPDGTNVQDRFRAALKAKMLSGELQKEIAP